MTLSPQQVRRQVLDYLEATECTLIEVSPFHVTAKLSPRADRMLTDRPYYWGFVERTGVEPETLSFTFVFDPENYEQGTSAERQPSLLPGASSAAIPGNGTSGNADTEAAAELQPPLGSGPAAPGTANPQDTILGRYFGIVPALPRLGPGLIRREDVAYGSKRLRQIWAAAREEGKYLYLFEEPLRLQRATLFSVAYEPWLGVCYKVEMTCDLKREELHFIGISLGSGTIVEHFGDMLSSRELTPRLPENVHIKPHELSVTDGTERLEAHLTSYLAGLDYTWAQEARKRLQLELDIVDAYYTELLKEQDEEKLQAIQEQYESRRKETSWQYEPHIAVSAVICGLFHLRST